MRTIICLAISEPSLSFVAANDSLNSTMEFAVILSTISLILLEFFIKFPAFHGSVFFPFVVGEKAVADIGAERLGRHKHAALHHQLGQTDASQKSRFASLVGACDYHEVFIVSIHIVAHNSLFHG